MPIDITFLRHAETESNAAGLWQGHGDSPITVTGRAQLARLAARMRGRRFDAVVSSDMGRAQATAAVLAQDFTADPAWREADLGEWEGMPRDEIYAEHGHVLEALRAGHDPRLGYTGERMSDVATRLHGAIGRLLEGLDDGSSALVVAHGGVVRTAVARALGARRALPLTGPLNTSLTTIRFYPRPFPGADNGHTGGQIAVYNDTAHLSGYVGLEADTSLLLVRHGESEGNVTNRWQGRFDAALTDRGLAQAGRVAVTMGAIDAVYSSPLRRARHTADAIAARADVDVTVVDDLAEFDFGAWEDMSPTDIKATYPDVWEAVYERGEDLPRGTTGETFSSAAVRVTAALEGIAARHRGETVAVVSHGGVSRAFAVTHLGLRFPERFRIGSLENTAISRLTHTARGFEVTSWNLTPHLESS